MRHLRKAPVSREAPVSRKALAGLMLGAVTLSGCAAWNEHTYRVHTVTSLAVSRDATGMTISASGHAAGEGWDKVTIRRVHSPTFPKGVLAYELVAVGDFRINPNRPTSWQRVGATLRVSPPPAGARLVNIIGGVNDKTVYLPRVGRKVRRGRMHK